MPRPKGLPKTGGRQRGTPSRLTAEIKTMVEQEAPGIDLVPAAESKVKEADSALEKPETRAWRPRTKLPEQPPAAT